MQLYEVNFSVGNTTLTQFQKTTVQAIGMAQARALVESMYGGSSNCQVHSVYPK